MIKSVGPAGLDSFVAQNTDSKLESKVEAKSDARVENTADTAPRVVASPKRSDTATQSETPSKTGFKSTLKTAINEGPSNPKASIPESEVEDSYDSDMALITQAMYGTTHPRPEAVEATAEAIDDSLGELHAALKFMKSMEEEFGISPEMLVQVMSNQQPVGAKNNFLKQLGLEGSDLKRAEFLYQNMLKEMAQENMANYLKSNNSEMNVEILSSQELRKRDLNQSIDRMSSAFFLNDVRAPYGRPQQPLPLQNPTPINPMNESQQYQQMMAKSDVGTDGAFAIPTGMESVTPQQAGQLSGLANQNQIKPQNANELSIKNNSDTDLRALAAVAAAQTPATPSGNVQSQLGEGSDFSEQGADLADLTKGNETSKVQEDSFASTFSVKSEAGPAKPELGLAALASPDAGAKESPEDAMNVRNLIQNAQVLMKKGGGEMKVQMHPEGMGQVDLKVGVKDGRVDVQILAETADAKRLLEKNIGDLKLNLTAQKLQVDNIKVDVSQNAEKNLSQDQQGDLNREQARQFLGQFRDEREAMRSGVFDLPRLRSYKPSPDTKVDIDTSDKPAAKNSTRLNVIA